MTIERPDLRKDNHDLLRKVQVVWQEIEQGIMMPKVKAVSCQLSFDSFLPHPWLAFSSNQRKPPFDPLSRLNWRTGMRLKNESRSMKEIMNEDRVWSVEGTMPTILESKSWQIGETNNHLYPPNPSQAPRKGSPRSRWEIRRNAPDLTYHPPTFRGSRSGWIE